MKLSIVVLCSRKMTHIFWQVSQQFAQVRRDPRLCLSWTLSVPTIRQEEEQLPTLHSDINQSPLSDPTAAFCCIVRHCCTHSGSAFHFFPLELVPLSFFGFIFRVQKLQK